MTGYHVGAVLTALLAIVVMSQAGLSWRWMFVIGGVPGLILAPMGGRRVGLIGAITGPIIIGALLSADSGHPEGFYVFAGVAALAAVVVLAVGKPRDVLAQEDVHEALTSAH